MAFYDPRGAGAGAREVGGRTIPVLTAPRLRHRGFLADLLNGIGSLAAGMRVTLATFIRPSRIVTRQYPENRATLKMYERYRAVLRLVHDAQGRHLCTACRNCEKACPNGSIAIGAAKGAITGKNELQSFVWRFDSCTFCNLCVVACPFEALEMKGDFEHAVFDRRLLVFNLNRYAGPHASLWDKVEGEEQRARLSVRVGPYDGPVPLNGAELPGLPARARDPGGTP
jgi:formate hydrogenlyase subunit 6/NADH:ubiquinone oxidoreductase subunit I